MPWQSCREHSVHAGCAAYEVHDFMRFFGWKPTHLAHIVSRHHLLLTGMLCELSGCDLEQRCLGNRAMNIRCFLCELNTRCMISMISLMMNFMMMCMMYFMISFMMRFMMDFNELHDQLDDHLHDQLHDVLHDQLHDQT